MFYAIIRFIFLVILVVFFRMRVEGHENVPRRGPVILAANHMSLLDPIVVGCALKRRVKFMAKAELFKNRAFGLVLRWLGTFPVRRGESDRDAFHRCFQVLEAGQVLGIFPEGTRSVDGRLGRFSSIAAVLSSKTGAPVVPVGILGTGQILRRGSFIPRLGRVVVRIGPPVAAGQAHDIEAGAGDMSKAGTVVNVDGAIRSASKGSIQDMTIKIANEVNRLIS
ncbi:MAG: 1-acyl-sn-glycerol-3-phosphate acyltransferase [Firmicutes bacterium]|nr:1-acyl-sn-glycerol-3-phosphate acyltransferase [Bacillota bacterium]